MFKKKFWKIAALSAACGLLVLLILYAGVAWWSTHRLEARLAKVRAAGEPISIADLEVPVPADDNAALVLGGVRPQLEQFSSAQATFDKTPQGAEYREAAFTSTEPTREQIDMIRGILAMTPEVPPALEKAANSNYHATPYDYSLDPLQFLEQLLSSQQLVRAAARYASWQMAVAIADKDYDRATQVGVNTLRLARVYDQEPLIVTGLVGLALRGMAVRDLNRVLRSGEISPETRLLLDQELATHDDPLWLVKVLKSERAYNLAASGDLFPHFPMAWQGRLLQADTLDVYEDLFEVLSKPWHETRGQINAAFRRSYSTPISGSLVQLFVPALQAANESYHRTVAQMRCLRILNAEQAYMEENGREAEPLDVLDLPASALLDPFDGKQLKLKKTDEGWLIYSAYRNGKDDDGDFENDNDTGIAPLGYPGAD